jgi:hypothetical protein
MAYTPPPTIPRFQAGRVPATTDLNGLVRDSWNGLLQRAVFRARRTTSLTIAAGHQFVAWNSAGIDEDNASGWSAGQPTRYTVPTAGWYLITAAVSLSGTGAANLVLIPSIAVNGVSLTGVGSNGWEGAEIRVPTGGTGEPKISSGLWEQYANAGDYFELDLWYSSESAITAVDTTAGQQCRIGIAWTGM